jgi:rubrerythrin
MGSAVRDPDRMNGAVTEPLVANPALFDPAVARVREAGGPIDRACYTCQCGYLFVAMVSTTVTCPHCGAEQAW